jgi:hypothetical protein
MKTTPSRRAILAGTATALAASSVVNLAAFAIAKAETQSQLGTEFADPIFAAIERHRAAYGAVEARSDWEDDELDDAVEAVTSIYDDALRLGGQPLTIAGWAALLRHVTMIESKISDVSPQLVDFIDRAAAALDRMAVRA